MTSWWEVFLFALVTAVATGLGALPFVLTRHFPRRWLGLANALAGGLMMGASFGLIYEGFDDGAALWRTLAGVLSGLLFISLTRRLLSGRQHARFAGLSELDAVKALLIVGVMTLHSFTEGVGVGVAFGEGQDFGLLITIAIAIHNVPEGLAISLVLVPRGSSVWRAGGWSVFSSLPQPVMAVPAFLFVAFFEAWLPVGLGFAAGAMIWMVFSELIPEAVQDASPNSVAITATAALVAMQAFQIVLA